MDIEEKHNVYMKHIQQKPCRICNINQSQKLDFILCDRCDDAFHWKCLDPPITSEVAESSSEWLCPQCLESYEMQSQYCQGQMDAKLFCPKCEQQISIISKFQIQAFVEGPNRRLSSVKVRTNYTPSKKCRFCCFTFHSQCFSKRSNCLNCTDCQKLIRNYCPKNHLSFLKYVQKDIDKIKEYKLLQLNALSQFDNHNSNRMKYLGLKVFEDPVDWQLICRSQASLFYALKTNRVHYCKSQLYKNSETMKLNKSKLNILLPSSLDEKDEKTFQKLKAKTNIPPLQIKQDYKKGFYAIALQQISAKTLLCQYTGEVCTRQESDGKHTQNDSVMSLIVTNFKNDSLDIAPENFSNMSRFIAGIPPKRKDLQNVATLNFCYYGRSHILFYTLKNIQKGQMLYIDYNDGVFEEYPTQHFVE